MAGRRRRRHGYGRSGGLEASPPVSGVPSLAERLESGDLPVGLTRGEVERAQPKLFDGLQPTTKDTYEKLASYFMEWCHGRQVDPKDVETAHLAVYMQQARERPEGAVSVSWLWGTLAAVRRDLKFKGLADRVNWEELADLVRGEHKAEKRAPVSADGLTWELIGRVVTAVWVPKPGEWPEKTRRRATFDTALILLMWGCLLRRGEAAGVRWGDISTEVVRGHAYGVLRIPFSKTDQTGRGEVGYIHVHTLVALQEMAHACGLDPSKPNQSVFGIGGRQISNRIKEACTHAGIPGRWSGHSPRVGASRDLMTYGFSLLETMQAGRWERPETVSRYVRSIAVGDGAMARLYADREPGQVLMPARVRLEASNGK